MTTAQGETAVTTSALIVSGLYGYRRVTETITKAPQVRTGPFKAGIESYVKAPLGYGELAPLGAWATGMGLTFILLSVATSINGTFGGSFAILVAVGAVLGNGQEVLKDLGHGLSGSSGTTAELSGEPKQSRLLLEAVASNHPPVK